jgi:beta-phosphoglucomutase-like phosphatase (HAD superfamily)
LPEPPEDSRLKVKAVIIDMDGTITKFNLDYISARRKALEELEKLSTASWKGANISPTFL